jgi:phosphate transport system protein
MPVRSAAAARKTRKDGPINGRATPFGHELAARAARGFLIAADAVSNLREFMHTSSRMAFLAVKDCERELDTLERQVDEELPHAITGTEEQTARELIASLRFITDLERIGDLVWWVTQRVHVPEKPLAPRQAAQLEEMAEILERMVRGIHKGLRQRDASAAGVVLRVDADMDHLRQSVFKDQLGGGKEIRMDLIMMAQCLERAGDHATNLAEELVHLIERRSIRHTAKKRV